ncbi:hypothetical protein FB451DRAFT_1455602 [Mycena latifolia]|nr:hypothetical protein FB451DRAFT_1455602 [Mycena latifolia]
MKRPRSFAKKPYTPANGEQEVPGPGQHNINADTFADPEDGFIPTRVDVKQALQRRNQEEADINLRDERYPPGNTCLQSRWMCGRLARMLRHPVGTLHCKRTTHRSAEDMTRASHPVYHNVDAQHACCERRQSREEHCAPCITAGMSTCYAHGVRAAPWRLRSSQKQCDEHDRRMSHASPPAQPRQPDESSVETYLWTRIEPDGREGVSIHRSERAGSGAAVREPAESGKSAGASQMRARTPGENDDSDSSPTTHDSGGAFARCINHTVQVEPRKRCI